MLLFLPLFYSYLVSKMKSERVILEDGLKALHKIVFRETSECEGGGEEKCMVLFYIPFYYSICGKYGK